MDPTSPPSNIQCHPSLLPGSTPTCFLPVSPSGQVSCGRWPGWTPHSGVGTATPLSSTASAPQNKGGGGFWGTLFRISSSLHGTLWHKNNSQKADFYPSPFLSPTSEQPDSPPATIGPHLTKTLVSSHSSPPLLSDKIGSNTDSRFSPQMQASSGVQPPQTTPILGRISP